MPDNKTVMYGLTSIVLMYNLTKDLFYQLCRYSLPRIVGKNKVFLLSRKLLQKNNVSGFYFQKTNTLQKDRNQFIEAFTEKIENQLKRNKSLKFYLLTKWLKIIKFIKGNKSKITYLLFPPRKTKQNPKSMGCGILNSIKKENKNKKLVSRTQVSITP